MNKILEAAVRAPSGDNVQPWEFKVSENFTRIDLYNLPDKDQSIYNYQQAASYIAHGAFIENIIIAGKHLGCQIDYQLFPDQSDDKYVALITLQEVKSLGDPLYPFIFERRTNRFQYDRLEVSNEVLQALNKSVNKIDTANVSLIIHRDRIKQLAKELMVNDRIVFECKEIHQFLFDKIRWNKKQIEETQDGMPVGVLGLSYIENLSFPLMRFWGYVKTANMLGLSRIIALKGWWGCKNASLLGMVTIQGNDKKSFVEGGRAVQRLWLEATKQGFCLQPIIGLPLLIHRYKQAALTPILAKHIEFVRRASEKLPKLFDVNKTDTLVMGFRAGGIVDKGGSVRTLRKKINMN